MIIRYLLITLSLTFFISTTAAEAQRGVNYQTLLQQAEQPNAYITQIAIPESDDEGLAGIAFRLDYDFIPFTRIRPGADAPFEDAQFSARVQMGLDIYSGKFRDSRRGRETRGSAVFRETFIDTVFVRTFEETQSRENHLEGVLSTRMSPGDYHYELRLTRGESIREIPSRIQNITVPSAQSTDSASVVLASNIKQDQNGLTAELLNYGRFVLYGEDFDILYALPDNAGDEFELAVTRMDAGSSSDSDAEPVYTAQLSADNLFAGSNPQLQKEGNAVTLTLDSAPESGNQFLYASVPNSDFQNASFRITLKNSDGDLVSNTVVNSRWIGMPVSLLNLDVAIDMLRFIVSRDELQEIRSGSRSDKERKFREFWAERDPSPEREFNELMAEYYSRIDHAYRNFTSMQQPGYETDQGHAYILYGEPDNVERRLLTDRPTREIWMYPNRTLVFEATTGFGDFRLISEQ